MDIKAEVKSITKLKDYFFIVPDYQREYVWKPEDQVEQFIIDIDNEYESIASDQKSYFIGSIIIVENNNKFDVIDGQQRLTTIILSLCAFRDLLRDKPLDTKQKKYLQTIEELLCDFDIQSDQTNYRLELQYEESKDYLEKLVQSISFDDSKTDSIVKMEQAYEKLKNHFESYLTISIDSLMEFLKYFLTKIEIVIIESENLSSALKIFETINQRGSGLNAMDLVKNLLFSQANETDFQKIKVIWKDITNNLEKCKEANNPLRFLRYFLMSRYYDGILREDDIYKWIISKEGKKSTNFEQDPLSFAKELQKISTRYSDLVLATEWMKDGGENPNVTNVGFINKYKSRQHLILLLALNVNAKKDILEYLASQIESFFFYSSSMSIQAKNNERLFSNWAIKLRGVNTVSDIEKVIDDTMLPYLKEKIPEFKSTFLNIRHTVYAPLYRLRFVLGKIENTILVKSGLPIKGKDFIEGLQVEHILPQTPKNKFFPTEFKDFDEYLNFVYKLGNVTLLESQINQAVNNFNDLSGDWFEQKQNEYTNSNLVSTNLLNNNFSIGTNTGLNRFKNDSKYIFDKWDKESITIRQEILLDLVFDTWRINDKRIDK
jgi:uncharacterized protein with ParB-like and HNH nuclease domain